MVKIFQYLLNKTFKLSEGKNISFRSCLHPLKTQKSSQMHRCCQKLRRRGCCEHFFSARRCSSPGRQAAVHREPGGCSGTQTRSKETLPSSIPAHHSRRHLDLKVREKTLIISSRVRPSASAMYLSFTRPPYVAR